MSGNHSIRGSEMLSQSNDDIPKEISVLEFVECRARELDALMQSVSAPVGGGNRTPMQLLPRHMRRRAANHDIRRLPLSKRLAAKKELDARPAAKRRPPSRRHRRRPSNLLEEYARRKRKHVWLETHIWHAKRFHMTEKWGYRLPDYPNDRGTRSVYRDSVRRCVLLDMSYYCCIELCGSQHILTESLARLTSPEIGPSFAAKCNLNGGREGRTVLYHADRYPWSAIGEVLYMWRSLRDACYSAEARRTLWIWTHPSCHDAVFAELKKVFGLTEANCQTLRVSGSNLNVEDSEMTSDCSSPLSKRVKLESLNDFTHAAKRQKLQESNSGAVVVVRTCNDKKEMDTDTQCENENITSTVLEMIAGVTCSTSISTDNVFVDSDSQKKTGSRKTKTECKKLMNSKKKAIKNKIAVISKVGLTRSVYDNGAVTLESLKDELCRFRLIGPTAHRIVAEALNFVDVDNFVEISSSNEAAETDTKDVLWWKRYYNNLEHNSQLQEQSSCWKTAVEQPNVSDFPMHAVISLLVKDPRLFLPTKRTPVSSYTSEVASCQISSLGLSTSVSPIWDRSVRDAVKLSKLTTADLNVLRSKYLVPGTVPDFGEQDSLVPILLVQRPSVTGHLPLSKHSTRSDAGYGTGWDVILPANWAMPFWMAFIYRGAKAAGLRDLRSLAFESGTLVAPDVCPETSAASGTSESRAAELRAAHERRPPAKRCNFNKLGIPTPFHCPWPQLVRGWCGSGDLPGLESSFYCLRNRKFLRQLADTSSSCKTAPKNRSNNSTCEAFSVNLLSNANLCIVQVTIRMLGRGVPGQFSLICIPKACDMQVRRGNRESSNSSISESVEPIHSKGKNGQLEISAASIVDGGTRRTFGFVVEGGFSHSIGCGFGVGFVTLPGLLELFSQSRPSKGRTSLRVLVRSTTSLHYHAAELSLFV